MKDKIVLFNNKSECCGCGTCQLVCPKQAISMIEDQYGFIYPHIDYSKCISCHLCQNTCAYQNYNKTNSPLEVYALSLKDMNLLYKTASGGVFGGMAKEWINKGGLVIGASLYYSNNRLNLKHVCVDNMESLDKLLGSKYVQSNLNNIFVETKQYLELGKKILFSGTPCQISALKSYLRKEYINLVTVDLICHGVPNQKMFQEYIACEEKKENKVINNFKFRDKEKGWGLNAKIIYKDKKDKIIKSFDSSFYKLFLDCEIYRENCYSCPYANEFRQGDLTIGDYWGIEIAHPEYLKPSGHLDQQKGISVLLVNTEKGKSLFEQNKDNYYYYISSFDKVSKHNKQLNHPSEKGQKRAKLLDIYIRKGYKGIEQYFWREKQKEMIVNGIKYHLHNDIPYPIRKLGKKILKIKGVNK